jgi:biopolymer transport protein ExbB/biopolymer transport protein TolQ
MLLDTIAFASEEAGSGFTMSEMWAHAGFIARSVIITLLLMGIACVVVWVERWLAFRKARQQSMDCAASIVSKFQQNDVAGALKIAQNEDYKASYLAPLLRAGLAELGTRTDEYGLANAKHAIEKAHTEEVAKMKRGMTILATTGATAPFVGLVGTTFGVINAFQGMATAGSGLASISAGISEALITTGIGIAVAVMGVWIFNYFQYRITKVTDELASSEADFVDWAVKLLQPQPSGK